MGRHVSVADAPRESFHQHPWALGGGGAAELKERLDGLCDKTLKQSPAFVAYNVVTAADDVYASTARTPPGDVVPMADGRQFRDWHYVALGTLLWPSAENAQIGRAHVCTPVT